MLRFDRLKMCGLKRKIRRTWKIWRILNPWRNYKEETRIHKCRV